MQNRCCACRFPVLTLQLLPSFSFPLQGKAAQTILGELLAVQATEAEEMAMQRQALLHALRKNDWQSVQILVNAGVTLLNDSRSGSAVRFQDLRQLYPRKPAEEDNDETAVPNALHFFMQQAKVLKKVEQMRSKKNEQVFVENSDSVLFIYPAFFSIR